MNIRRLRAGATRLYAAFALGRELVRAFEEAMADGWMTEAELGTLAVRLARTYERITGRAFLAEEPISRPDNTAGG